MLTSFKKQKNISIIILKEDIFISNANELKKIIDSFIEEGKNKIIIDCNETKYISSLGIKVIVDTLKILRKQGGDLKLCGVSDDLYRVFCDKGHAEYIDFFKNQEDVVLAFGGEVGVQEKVLLWGI